MKSRALIISSFMVLSIVSWHFLDGFILRNYIALIPLLFSFQILLNDFIETYLFMKLDTFWFRFLIAPGTILHEISHAAAARMTGCRITSISLFRLRPRNGNMGSVEYTQARDTLSVIRCFIVGLAPFFGCGIVLIALLNFTQGYYSDGFLTPATMETDTADSVLASMYAIVLEFYHQFSFITYKPAIPFLLYLQICAGLGAAPSSVDFRGILSSAIKHPLGTLILLLSLASIFYMSEHPSTTQYVVFAFRWILLTLLVSVSLLLASIPIIYVGANFMGLSSTKKFATVAISAIAYLTTESPTLTLAAFLVALFGIRYSWIFLKPD